MSHGPRPKFWQPGEPLPGMSREPYLRPWLERIKEAEAWDRQHGQYIAGDSALAVVLGSMEQAAYEGDPEFDSRVGGDPE